MTKLTVLVVDNDQEVCRSVCSQLSDRKEVCVLVARSQEEASAHIKKQFISIALVDLFLTSEPSGQLVIRELNYLRPSCLCILMTELVDQAGLETYSLMHPRGRGADRLLIKGAEGLGEVVGELADQASRRSVEVANAEVVRSRLHEKLGRWRSWKDEEARKEHQESQWADLTREEIEFLVSSILRGDASDSSDDDITSITLTEQGGGRSSSAVFKGKPRTRAGHTGNLCIFKFGPKEEIEAEYRSYNRYVRFYRSTYRRVEALGYAEGDTVSVVCYSFAGPSPDGAGVTSVQELLEREDDEAATYLGFQLDPRRKEWYLQEYPGKELPKFFADHYHLRAEEVTRQVKRLVTGERGFQQTAGGYVVDGPPPGWVLEPGEPERRLLLPTTGDLGSIARAYPRFRSCIVHGDLNAGNVLVATTPAADPSDGGVPAAEPRVITIDYRHTRRGPIFIDFSALEASVRLTETSLGRFTTKELFSRLAALEAEERRLWDSAWTATDAQPADGGSPDLPYWARMSRRLMVLARRNFESDQEGMRTPDCEREYAATCVLYCLRLLKIPCLAEPFTPQAQLRLMAWLSSLLRVLHRHNGRSPAHG